MSPRRKSTFQCKFDFSTNPPLAGSLKAALRLSRARNQGPASELLDLQFKLAVAPFSFKPAADELAVICFILGQQRLMQPEQRACIAPGFQKVGAEHFFCPGGLSIHEQSGT